MDRKRKTKKINLLDLFSGIGGFSLGVYQAGIDVGWHGYSEIDKFANELFKRRFEDAAELGSITNVSYKSLKGKRIDLLTGGFPCQAFSIAGKRRGFDDTRGTLFFEIARILKDYIKNKQPIPCILLENVKGLLSHDNRRTFTTIYKVLADLNYTIECQVVNTRWFLPQNRERIFIFGRYNGRSSGRKVFPIGKNDIKVSKNGESKIEVSNASPKEFGWKEFCPTLLARDYKDPKLVKLNQIGVIEKDSEATRVYDTSCSRTIKNGGGMGAKTGLYKVNSDVRRLTPTECERLQGFPDGWTDGQSDTQRYKQCGNAVSVPVIKAIMEKIYG